MIAGKSILQTAPAKALCIYLMDGIVYCRDAHLWRLPPNRSSKATIMAGYNGTFVTP